MVPSKRRRLMAIFRFVHNRENPYVQINKESLWDPELSLAGAGLWARILSKPDNWEICPQQIAKSCGCSLKVIYKLLKQLIDAGYISRRQDMPKGKRGFSSVVYEVYEFKEKLTCDRFEKRVNTLGVKGNTNKEGYEQPVSKDTSQKETKSTPPAPKGEFVCTGKFVRLLEKDHNELKEKLGAERLAIVIDEINDYLASTGKKPYRDYAATIRNWVRRKESMNPPIPANPPYRGNAPGSTETRFPSSGRVDRYLESKNKELAEKMALKRVPGVSVGYNYIEFSSGPNSYEKIRFDEHGFEERVRTKLLKWGLSFEEIQSTS